MNKFNNILKKINNFQSFIKVTTFTILAIVFITFVLNRDRVTDQLNNNANNQTEKQLFESVEFEITEVKPNYYKIGNNAINVEGNKAKYWVYDYTPTEDEIIKLANYLGISPNSITVEANEFQDRPAADNPDDLVNVDFIPVYPDGFQDE